MASSAASDLEPERDFLEDETPREDDTEDSKVHGKSGSRCSALKVAMGLMTLFFVLASIAQLNDPDSLLWMCIYILPAVLTFLTLLNLRYLDNSWWWLITVADLGAHAAFSFSFITAAAEKGRLSWDVLHLEESRESCGLVITSIWLIFLLCIASNKLRPCGFGNLWVTSAALIFSIIPLLCWIGYKVYWQMHCDIPEHCAGIL